MLDRIQRLAIQTLDDLDSSGYVASAALRFFARSKRARPVRTRSEFDVRRLQRRMDRPRQPSAAYCWSLEDIYRARDSQMAGHFMAPAELAAAFNSDDALFVARQNRLAPIESMGVELLPGCDNARAASVAGEADALFGDHGCGISAGDIKSINRDLADHGVAFGFNSWCARPDGSRIDIVHQHWPIRDTRWDPHTERFLTNIQADQEAPPTTAPADRDYGRLITQVPIVHGDGRWVIYTNQRHHPWQHDAALLPGALVWARHAFPSRDWISSSQAHGNINWLGTLPPQVPLQQASTDNPEQFVLTREAQAMLDLMGDLAGLEQPYGIVPNGAAVDMKVNPSRAWEVFEKLIQNAEKAAARIWLGTDGILGSQGGAPGVDISALFGVASTIIQGDVGAITRGFHGGVLEPWAAVNFGDSLLVPTRSYQIPDPDLQQAREQLIANEQAYVAAVTARQQAGFAAADPVAFQAWADELAKRLGVAPAKLQLIQGGAAAAQGEAPDEPAPVSETRPIGAAA